MALTYFGFDPGKKGGMAAILPNEDIMLAPLPHWVAGAKKNGSKLEYVDSLAVRDFILEVHNRVCPNLGETWAFAVVERMQPMPGREGEGQERDTGMTTLSLGTSLGVLVAVLRLQGIGMELPAPRSWKTVMGTNSDESVTKARAKALFPFVNLIPPRGRVEHAGLADALLLAEYGRRLRAC